MIRWKVENGVLTISFENEADIVTFIDQVIRGPASQFGLEIEVRKRAQAQTGSPSSQSTSRTVRL
ncbi:MAG: hypothetical protein QXP81_09875 [Nitrososphaerota archaeon]